MCGLKKGNLNGEIKVEAIQYFHTFVRLNNPIKTITTCSRKTNLSVIITLQDNDQPVQVHIHLILIKWTNGYFLKCIVPFCDSSANSVEQI